MKKKSNIFFIFLAAAILMYACDKKNTVVVIKNKSVHFLVGAAIYDGPLTDSDLYQNQVAMNVNVPPAKFQDIGLLNFKIGNKLDSTKLYLYVFYDDSLSKYQHLKMKKGILAKTLVKKVIIQLNKVRKVDTIYVK